MKLLLPLSVLLIVILIFPLVLQADQIDENIGVAVDSWIIEPNLDLAVK